ncbi:MAG: MarR family transcriptional regulator [Cytophagaceae bacterium]|nr:MarR family transcriptional regulator [Cytophagaceae bacterium]
MNKTVHLVNLWGEFEAKHPDAEIEDFCRYYLTTTREKENAGKLFGGLMPPTDKIILSKLIQRLFTFQQTYANASLSNIPIKQLEEFLILNAVSNLKEGKKTEIIHTVLMELSTGLNILSNLLKQEFITEEEDKIDKRSKRVKITPKGEKVLQDCYRQMRKANSFMFQDMAEEDILLTIQLLKNSEIRHSALWLQNKGKTFDEIVIAANATSSDQKD